jgi:hypothetical protein
VSEEQEGRREPGSRNVCVGWGCSGPAPSEKLAGLPVEGEVDGRHQQRRAACQALHHQLPSVKNTRQSSTGGTRDSDGGVNGKSHAIICDMYLTDYINYDDAQVLTFL